MAVHRLPPLNAVRAFEAAARLGSYVAAAQELHVTQPAIGRHVKALEERLQTQLFQRTPRGVVLTEDGWRYFEQVSAALTQIAEASYELTSRAQQRWLRLLVVPGFAGRWLRHHLAEFRALHPGIRIALEPNPSFREVTAERADLGIAFGEGEEFSAPREVLVQPPIFPVCSPAFLLEHGPLAGVEDLLRLPLLHEDDGYWWGVWLQSQGLRARLSSEMSYVSADQVIDLALAGAGVALTNGLLVEEELASGRLVRPLGNQAVLEGYLLLSPAGGLKPEAKLFRQWLFAKLASLQV
ncbi:LysR substrate-binding domain-containing protein [Aquipseudomonas alcaligenes]|uniref:Transcriptional regulator, LysR family n=1 Tax=Aquipseudomonas alcaligenes TaxID=43263 RepID=A0A1N6SY70_AQUAC|nr:LysR substrate-binding domain-containing protein [Pseudomonas alcaligenes]SIQ45927.1 transcriptional regulator, LysR family [Pseudomonas alcaligenes]